MIDETTFIYKTKSNGNRHKQFKATCDGCGNDRGFIDKSDASKLCRSCTRKRVHESWSTEKKKEIGKKSTRHFVGLKPWNKGKTGIYSLELIKQWQEKHIEIMQDPDNRIKAGTGLRSSWCKGTELSEEIRQKISCTHRKIALDEFDDFKHTSKDHDRMKVDYLNLPKQCFERDNYICQICNIRGAELNAHHMNGFDLFLDERFDLNNLITLCKTCHDNFHSTYGKGKNTKDQFALFKSENKV